ncbi:uncharacterized protein [Miscanthus floridulus]|uniref:uncharacterized protein n=1 Tax=Miscanthus floridulus TaxID=154761 RepID=UPI003457857D
MCIVIRSQWTMIDTCGPYNLGGSTTLRAEYEQIMFRNGESIKDFALCLSNIMQRLVILDDLEPEPKVVAKYLRVARPRYKQLLISIETLLDIDTISVEEVTGRLKAATDNEPSLAQDVAGKLLLMEEQWLEYYKKQDKDNGHDGSSFSSRGKCQGRGRGRGTSSRSDSWTDSNSGQTIPDDVCKAYRKKGHWAKDCRSKKEDGIYPQIEPLTPETSAATLLSIRHDSQLHFTKSKVFAAFDESDDRDLKRWVLDMGTSNHMSEMWATFSSLDSDVTGSVWFEDGSIARIEGIGTILLSYKNGEHRAIANVYYLPRLTTNIISIG